MILANEIFDDENCLPPPLTSESKQQVGLREIPVQEKDKIETALKDTGGRGGPHRAAVGLGCRDLRWNRRFGR